MRPAILVPIFLACLTAAPVLADIPPPPRPPETVGKLIFDFDRTSSPRPNGERGVNRGFMAILKGCAGKSANCDAVKKAGVIGWKLLSAGGQAMDNPGPNALHAAFAATPKGSKITLVFEQVVAQTPPHKIEVSLNPK